MLVYQGNQAVAILNGIAAKLIYYVFDIVYHTARR